MIFLPSGEMVDEEMAGNGANEGSDADGAVENALGVGLLQLDAVDPVDCFSGDAAIVDSCVSKIEEGKRDVE